MRYGFAHRGGRTLGPDNRLTTFTAALSYGATGLETDAWLTADGAVVLDHDGVHRAARRRRIPIREVRLADLPVHVPTLDALYQSCGVNFDLAIDVKAAPVANAVREQAAQHDALDRLWLVTPAGTTETTAILQAGRGAHLAVTVRGNTLRGPGRGAALGFAEATGCAAVNARWMWWTRSLVAAVHRRGLLAFGYDAQRANSLRRCARLGLDGVFSDDVDLMLATLSNEAGGR